MNGPLEPARRDLTLLAWAGLLLCLGYSWFEIFILRPGVGAPEELQMLSSAWGRSLGLGEPLRFGGAELTRLLQMAATALLQDWHGVYLVNLAALIAEAWLLLRLTRREGAPEAGVWAVLLMVCAAFTYLRARTLFAYVQVPALSLVLAYLLRQRHGKAVSALLGLASGTLWLDYEGWVLVAPGLAAAWWSAKVGARAHGAWLLGGLALGLALVAALSAPFLAEWWHYRLEAVQGAENSAASAFANLRGYFFGSNTRRAMGLEELAAFPWLAWPGLLVGVRAAPRWLWVWALGGLLGLIPGGIFQEPNRAIAAWPALMLISGYGSAALLRGLAPRAVSATALTVVLFGSLQGYLQFDHAVSTWDQRIHAQSRRFLIAAELLKTRARSRSLQVLTELDFQGGGAFRTLMGPLPEAGKEAELWALVPRPYADPADARWGHWIEIRPGPDELPTYLLRVNSRLAGRLTATEASLVKAKRHAGRTGRQRLESLRLADLGTLDAWAWTALVEERARLALALGQAEPSDLGLPLSGPCLSERLLDHLSTVAPSLKKPAQLRRLSLSLNGSRRFDLYLRRL